MPLIKRDEHYQMHLNKLSGPSLKKQVTKMIVNSTQCQAIFECVNSETGEYKLVLHGVLDLETRC